MKIIYTLAILALSISIAVSASTVTSTTTTSRLNAITDLGICSAQIYKCVVDKVEDDGTAANKADSITFTWTATDGGSAMTFTKDTHYYQYDIIDLTTPKLESYIVIVGNYLTKTTTDNYEVTCTQAQSRSSTATTGGSYVGKASTVTLTTATCVSSNQPKLKIEEKLSGTTCTSDYSIIGGSSADKFLVFGGQSVFSSVDQSEKFTIDTMSSTPIIVAKQDNNINQLVTKLSIGASADECALPDITDTSATTEVCDVFVQELEITKDASNVSDSDEVVVQKDVSGTITTLTENTDYWVVKVNPSATTKSKYAVIVKPGTLAAADKINFQIGIKEFDLSFNQIGLLRYKTSSITGANTSGAACVNYKMETFQDNKCVDTMIIDKVKGVWTYYGENTTVTGLPASGSEATSITNDKIQSGFYINRDASGAIGYLRQYSSPSTCFNAILESNPPDICTDMAVKIYTNQASATPTPTYAWVSPNYDISSLSLNTETLNIPKNTLTDKTPIFVTGTASYGLNNSSTQDFTINLDNLVDTACTPAVCPAADPAAADNSTILSVLVLLLLTIIF